MPDIQKISVAVTGEQLAVLKAAVEAGEYATTSEIIREAIRDWQFKRKLRQEDIKRLRASIGMRARPRPAAKPLDSMSCRQEAQKRLAEAKKGVTG